MPSTLATWCSICSAPVAVCAAGPADAANDIKPMTPPSRPQRARDSKFLDMGFLRSIAACRVTLRDHPCRTSGHSPGQALVSRCEALLAAASDDPPACGCDGGTVAAYRRTVLCVNLRRGSGGCGIRWHDRSG